MKIGKKFNFEIDRDTARLALPLAAVPIILSWLQVENPYFLSEKVTRFAIYSATMLLPVIFEIILARIGIGFGQTIFYIVGYIVYVPIFYLTILFYRRSGNRKLFVVKFLAVFILLITLAVFLLW